MVSRVTSVIANGAENIQRYSISAPSHHLAGCLLDLLLSPWYGYEAASYQGPNGHVQVLNNA